MTSEAMLYPKGLYRGSLMCSLGVSFSNSYLRVQLHGIFFHHWDQLHKSQSMMILAVFTVNTQKGTHFIEMKSKDVGSFP